MKIWAKLKQKENSIWALGVCVFLCAAMGIAFDYYYDLNDDVMMKDILAGVYTGVPSGHNIQMLYPVSFFLSLCYRIARALPWYGIFLCLCQFGSVYLITERMLRFAKGRAWKVVMVSLEAGLIIALFLREFVYVQYTVTCSLLAAAAAFLFCTCDVYENGPGTPKAGVKVFFARNLPSILLVTLSFQIRSEMLLLLLPLICVAGLCKWAEERPFFTKQNVAKYMAVFGGIVVGLALSQGVHRIAYGSEDWRQFTRYFNNRTELYDFLGIPPYEGNEAFYESVGLSQSEQILLKNYNFGLDEEINDALLKKVCEYADGLRREKTSFGATFKEAVRNYLYRTRHMAAGEGADYPWNLCVAVLYLFVLLLALYNRHFGILWELPCMAAVRSGLWLYILYRGRDPERITHSLYLMETVILFSLLLTEWVKKSRRTSGIKGICLSVFVLLILSNASGSITGVRAEQERREEVNAAQDAFREYALANGENFYFLDVYSTVAFSEKLFAKTGSTPANYDIMGGWVSKSPLMREKYARFGIENMEAALQTMEQVYVVVETEPSGYVPDLGEWLPAYYAGHGREVTLEKDDRVFAGGKAVFEVYRVR